MNTFLFSKVRSSFSIRFLTLEQFFLVDIDDERRQILRMKVKHGLAASEILKKRIRESAMVPRPLPTVIPSNDCKFLYFTDLIHNQMCF